MLKNVIPRQKNQIEAVQITNVSRIFERKNLAAVLQLFIRWQDLNFFKFNTFQQTAMQPIWHKVLFDQAIPDEYLWQQFFRDSLPQFYRLAKR